MDSTARPKISIIVTNWNGRKLLAECLESLCNQTYLKNEIIVADNGSTDSSVPFIQTNFPQCKVIPLSKNEGFTGGNIKGLGVATGEFIALLNNDARADRLWLESLLQPMLQDPTVGICASKLIFDRRSVINSAGNGLTTGGVGFNRGLGGNSNAYNFYEFVFGACGAGVLYRRKMLDEIGFLDEDFFLYDDDTDLSFRAQLAGWKCAYIPTAVVYHKGNATAGRLTDVHVYYHTRNLEFVWIKNMPLALMLRFAHHKLFQEIGSFCYLCLRHGKWGAFFKAKRDALTMSPVMWRKRRLIQVKRRVPNSYLRPLLTSVFTFTFLKQKVKQLFEKIHTSATPAPMPSGIDVRGGSQASSVDFME